MVQNSPHYSNTPFRVASPLKPSDWQWYYGNIGQQSGPLSTNELKSLLTKRQIDLHTLVWREGLTSLVSLSTIPELIVVEKPPRKPLSSFAIASLTLGIVSLLMIFANSFFALFLSLPAVIFGLLSLIQTKGNQAEQTPDRRPLFILLGGSLSIGISLFLLSTFLLTITLIPCLAYLFLLKKKPTLMKQWLSKISSLLPSDLLEEPSPAPPSQPWHYGLNGQPIGPYSQLKIQSLLHHREINLNTPIWREGFTETPPISSIPELMGEKSDPKNNPPNQQNRYALICIILAIIGLPFVFLYAILSIALAISALILGHIALKQIKANQPNKTDHGMALSGVIISYLSLAINLAGAAVLGRFFLTGIAMIS